MQRQDDIHVPYLFASLALAVFGGFTLAVSLPIEAALGGFDVGWVSHAQVHGHLQVVGFAGLFVAGMAMKLAPRFGSRSTVALPGLVTPALVLLVAGVLFRALGQPLADHPRFDALLIAGVASELAGALCLAAAVLATLRASMRIGDPSALLLGGAMVWFAVQAAFGAWWLAQLAGEGGTILESTRNSALVNMQFFGLILGAVLGVGMRSFPTFFGMRPTPRPMGLAVFVLLNAGLAFWVAGAAWDMPERLEAVGRLGVGAAIILAVLNFGLTARKHRLAAASSGYIWALRPVMLWLALTGALLAIGGGQSLASGSRASTEDIDAIRHIFAVGVVTLAIVAMAQLILPEFASERLVRKPSPWRGAIFGVVLSLAAIFRGVLPYLGDTVGVEGELRWWLMGAGGTLGLAASIGFAILFWRARRSHVAYMRRIREMRKQQTALNVVSS